MQQISWSRIDRDNIRTHQPTIPSPTNAARMTRGFSPLASVSRYSAEVDKVQVLTEATSNIAQIALFVGLYKLANATIAGQIFKDLVAYITVQLPNVTAATSVYRKNVVSALHDADIVELRRELSELCVGAHVSSAQSLHAERDAQGDHGGCGRRSGRGSRGS